MRRYFFGREALVENLIARLGEDNQYSRILAVVEPSGSGKSSVVKAGLIPALRQGEYRAQRIGSILICSPVRTRLKNWKSLCCVSQVVLRTLVNRSCVTIGINSNTRLVLPDKNSQLCLVIDQFEESFTPG